MSQVGDLGNEDPEGEGPGSWRCPAASHAAGEVRDLREFTQNLKSLTSGLFRSWGPWAPEFAHSAALCSVPREKVFCCPSPTGQVGPKREFYSFDLRHVAPSTLVDQKALDSESCLLWTTPEANHKPRLGALRGPCSSLSLAVLTFCCCLFNCLSLPHNWKLRMGDYSLPGSLRCPQSPTWHLARGGPLVIIVQEWMRSAQICEPASAQWG